MDHILSTLMFFFLVTVTTSSEAVATEKVTKILFYVQDRPSGANRTVYPVAQSNITSTSPTFFGLVNMMDQLITVGPEAQSGDLARFQGIAASTDLRNFAFHLSVSVVFTSGEYNGSTLSIVGRSDFTQKYRQVPIVGGTGVFAKARGIATSFTYSNDGSVHEYNVVVHH